MKRTRAATAILVLVVRLGVGTGLCRPGLVDILLLIYADLLSDRVELSGHVIGNGLWVLPRPQAADRLCHGLIVFVLLEKRQIEQSLLAGELDSVEIGARIRP